MSERNDKYYTLAVWDDARGWAPQFGDFDRNVVKQEQEDYYRYHYASRHIAIVWTWYKDGQSAIDEQIAKLPHP